MSTMNLMPDMALESYVDAQNGYVQTMSVDMLSDMSWPCQFLSPTLSPEYMEMPTYPLTPISPSSMPVLSSDNTQCITSARQRQYPPRLSARPSITSTQSSGSPISPREGFAIMIQPPRQDRERRKAQNRASQRAYRERKEVQLRDLAASLKELEMAMAEAKHDNEQLEDRLGRMKNEMEVLRKENEALRRTEEAPQAGSRVQEKITLTRDKLSMETTRRVQGKPMLPHSDEGYEGDSRSNTASAISTPKDMDMGVIDWDRMLLKGMPAVADVDDQIFS